MKKLFGTNAQRGVNNQPLYDELWNVVFNVTTPFHSKPFGYINLDLQLIVFNGEEFLNSLGYNLDNDLTYLSWEDINEQVQMVSRDMSANQLEGADVFIKGEFK